MLYKNVVRLCEKRGITIAKLEKETGLGNATVRGWEKATPNFRTLSAVASYFGVSVDDLMHKDMVADQKSD